MLEHSAILLTCIKLYICNQSRKPIFGLFEIGRFTQFLPYNLSSSVRRGFGGLPHLVKNTAKKVFAPNFEGLELLTASTGERKNVRKVPFSYDQVNSVYWSFYFHMVKRQIPNDVNAGDHFHYKSKSKNHMPLKYYQPCWRNIRF